MLAYYSIQQQQHMHITLDVLTEKYVRLLFIQGANIETVIIISK